MCQGLCILTKYIASEFYILLNGIRNDLLRYKNKGHSKNECPLHWCGKWDLNPHANTDTSTSSLPVCRFQHPRKSAYLLYQNIALLSSTKIGNFAILSPVKFLQISKTNSQSKPQNDKIMLDKPRSLCYNDYPNKGP